MLFELTYACSFGNPEIVRALIEAGVDLNTDQAAIQCAIQVQNIEVIDVLLEAGVDVNGRAGNGWTPLMLAADDKCPKSIVKLLQKGADVNLQNDFGATALLMAVPSIRIVQILLKEPVLVNRPDTNGEKLLEIYLTYRLGHGN